MRWDPRTPSWMIQTAREKVRMYTSQGSWLLFLTIEVCVLVQELQEVRRRMLWDIYTLRENVLL